MKLLAQKPNRLTGRDAPDAAAIECDCGEHFLWERGRGDRVTCPTCKKTQTLDFSAPPVAMTKPEAEGVAVDEPTLFEQVAAAQASSETAKASPDPAEVTSE